MQSLSLYIINAPFQGWLDSTTEKEFMDKQTSTRVYEFATGHKPLPGFLEKGLMAGLITFINWFHSRKRILRVYYSPLFFTVYILLSWFSLFSLLISCSFMFILLVSWLPLNFCSISYLVDFISLVSLLISSLCMFIVFLLSCLPLSFFQYLVKCVTLDWHPFWLCVLVLAMPVSGNS